MKQRTRDILILLATAALVLLADQASKYFVVARLGEGQSWEVIPWLTPFFRITYVTNTGVAFGLFPQWGNFFIVVAAIVIVVIVLYYHYLPDGQWLTRLSLGLQLGGAIGNLVDRLRQGFVVDFIDLSFWPLHNWPIFNLADTAVVAGVTVLALVMLWEEWREQGKQRATEGG
ncbi:MAG: signal peptidase II [Chloroflexota bacterium]|nr:signal peptidase II [Chloroflexota bacterium]